MRLARVRLVGVGPFDNVEVPFCDELSAPRAVTCVTGSGGVGKTTLLAALGSTRPGYCVAQHRRRSPPYASSSPSGSPPSSSPAGAPPSSSHPDVPSAGSPPGMPTTGLLTGAPSARLPAGTPSAGAPAVGTPFVVADWLPSDDDPRRPHPVRFVSPNASPEEEGEEGALLRRREQALFERRAAEGGFVLVAFSAARWFSRSPLVLSAPDRALGRYDVRSPLSFDDATRADLTRETKQALAYAGVGAALYARGAPGAQRPPEARARAEAFEAAMVEVVGKLVRLAGFDYESVDPLSLEPTFRRPRGEAAPFDDLPTGVRHLASFGALTLRALYAAYPQRDPRSAEAVVLIDEAGLHLEASAQRALAPTLRSVLPRVQWVLTGSSPALAEGCEADEVLALRRLPASPKVELFAGELATLH
ncbi:MAG: hypothetical protein MUF34_16390 [Polyangiaceae bacterium]|nr:hypothetical protein [Polyangiaceae bacterium]